MRTRRTGGVGPLVGAVSTALTAALVACAFGSPPGPPPAGGGAGEGAGGGAAPATGAVDEPEAIPVGRGTLRQDRVTLSLRRGDLLLKVTPLAEGVIRVTAPDTYQRLRGLREDHRAELRRRTGLDDPPLFLVSFFSYEPDVPFEPEDVHLVNRGLRYRPLALRPVTPGWGTQRLDQEETQMAVFAYGRGIDLDQELAVEYRGDRGGGWDGILRSIQAERARVLARERSGD